MVIVKGSAYLSAVFLTITITSHQRNTRYLNSPGSIKPSTRGRAQATSNAIILREVTLQLCWVSSPTTR